jgi:pimeloyl-ACP methyl ester carboxylesterase
MDASPVLRHARLAALVALACLASASAPARGGDGHHASAALRDAIAASNQGERHERDNVSSCVDSFYESATRAYAAIVAAGPDREGVNRAIHVYNEALAACLRTAGPYGRLDPRSHLLIQGRSGWVTVPIVHRGFVWRPDDFARLHDPRCAERNPFQKGSRERHGLGATQVVERPNPNADASDALLPKVAHFPATAVLRPGDPTIGDGAVLELHDPLRTRCVPLEGRNAVLASDPDAPIAFAQQALDNKQMAFMGFIDPGTSIEMARFGLIEPYQPGKVVVVFIHGLLDNPFTFTDMVNTLRARPGFVDHFQVATFRYPTGVAFLRSASILRAKMREAEAALDPTRSDPGFQNMVLVGYSMGGLVSKAQITYSGDAVWRIAANRPLEAIVTTETSRAFLRDIFFFEPAPFVRRVVFIATPHEGSGLATRALGRFATSLVQRPNDSVAICEQIDRDNPGVLTDYMRRLPTSIDTMALDNPLLLTMERLPINPATRYHVIAGTGYAPTSLARGDTVVPLRSAHVDGADSELWVPAVHTDIYRRPQTIDEVDRVLRLHLTEMGATP